ncbi:hypothetical protein [Spongiibacter tropicus]|uniref:hypothetical protein n=1 Tax=Spongiibacter tropicus TaxID=454602 RepID=UPI0023549C07|nr:hypothetical protein [Spongiibacter tropicus]|tara:strand:+ start:1296 stop:1766 length:471 start_codon:yes stop_codon:yes gene_type:complete
MGFKFLGIEELKEELFKDHPVWVLYEGPEQDEEISGWGVDLDQAWNAKNENQENEYYFPYLGTQEPTLVRGTKVYCSVQTSGGKKLTGLLIGGFAFSVFALGEQFSFNRNMPDLGAAASAELCLTVGESEDSVFPLSFVPEAKCFSGKSTIHGKYW